ncbi:MAG: hypothetical protein R3E39_22090 [Anaerolineae bacterium]
MSIIKQRVDDIVIYELEADDFHRISNMQTIFTELMPQYAHYTSRLQRDIEHAGHTRSEVRHHVWLIEIKDKPVAMCAFEYIRSENVGLGMDIAVYPAYRSVRQHGRTLAAFILHEMVNQLSVDGMEAGHSDAVPMAGEVDNDRLLDRYIEYGFVPIPANYFEPPDVSGKSDMVIQGRIPFDAERQLQALGYHPMRLGFFPPHRTDFDTADVGMWERLIRAFYVHHYHLAPQSLALQVAIASLYPANTRSVA